MTANVNRYEERLGTDRILPLVLKMALPAVTAQIVNLLYNIVDRIYIGHIPGIGTDALAGVGVTNALIILVSAFSAIVSGGGAPFAAIALGQGNREKAETILGNGFVLLLIFTVLTSAVAYIFMEPILLYTGASENTIGYATDYLSIYLIGTVFVQISVGLNTFINTQGRPAIAMLSTLIGAGLNIVLDPIFIFLFDMGVKGAAVATVISQACSAAWVLGFLFSKKSMASTESLVGFVLNTNLKHFGDLYVSALAVMQSAMQFGSAPLTGFAQGFIPIVSYNYGCRNVSRVRECFKVSVTIMFTFNAVLMVLMIIFPETVARIFTGDGRLVACVGEMMPWFLTGMTVFGLQRACQNTFIALGQARISLFIALLRKVILLVPLAFILPRFMGVKGVFAAESMADMTAAICCITIFLLTFPKILSRINTDPRT